MKTNTTKTSMLQKFTLMAENLEAVLPPGTSSLSLGGQPDTVPSLVTDFQSGANNANGVLAARAALKAAIATNTAAEAGLRAKYTLVEDYLKATLGPANPTLEQVGITPATPKAVPSTVTKMAAQLKRQSTVKAKAAKQVAPIRVAMFGPDGEPLPGSASVPTTSSPASAAVSPTVAPTAK